MTVAKILEISSQSPEGFEEAIRVGIARAAKTVKGIQSAWVEDQEVLVSDGRITGYRAHLKVTFVLED